MFGKEEARISAAIEALREESATLDDLKPVDDLAARFEEVAALLRDLDVDSMWQTANDAERRVLVEEMIESIAFFPDHLEVKVAGAPKLNVGLGEVGLREYQTVGVEGGT